ncbi:hypothetical protein HN371_19915 [Candidatus Poribacteria bacterium]|jgi:hypothetical protein|nr:hypothetical protein [Candidatus Poribacteria bacterium]MBT5534003.1 hypothetical protein [Candidatus Poribacteria bacterium]MBT7808063.1 hypothetical protein [Candidatus Poribacteria bacterium]
MNEQLQDEQRNDDPEPHGENHEKGHGMNEQIPITAPAVTVQSPAANTISTQEDRPRRCVSIQVVDIELSDDVQSRVAVNKGVINDFEEAMKAGDEFPPIVVFHDGETYWCADGWHRVHAAMKAKKETIEADIYEGGKEDALLHSVGANATHGLRRTNKDKRRAITILLQHEVWGKWSVREIARRAGVTHPTVTSVRQKLEEARQGGKVYHSKPDPEGDDDGEDTASQNADRSETDAGDPEQRDPHGDGPSPPEGGGAPDESRKDGDSPDEQSDAPRPDDAPEAAVRTDAPADDLSATVEGLVESTTDTIEELEARVANGSATREDAVQAVEDAIRRILEVLSVGRIRIKEAGDSTGDASKRPAEA